MERKSALRRNCLVVAFLLILCPTVAGQSRTKVACVGNSVTYGFKLENPAQDAYPSQLQRLLGDAYEVGNFGKSGATLLRRGHRPYIQQEEFRQALRFAGDIVVIHLGLNDTDPRNWPNFSDDFVRDYLALMDSLRGANPAARFLIARMTPIADRHARFQSGTKLWHGEIQNAIETVARVSGAELIDLHEPLYAYPWMLPDALHPNPEGAARIAKTVCNAITGDYGGLNLSPLYSDNMVLQRRRPLPLCGTANAGQVVTLRLADSESRTVAELSDTTDNRGRWYITLPALEAMEGLTLTVEVRDSRARRKNQLIEQHTFRNVAVGEVWLCSGQSNMAWRLEQAIGGKETASTDEGLRLYDMKENWSTDNDGWAASAIDSVRHLLYYKPTTWQPTTPDNARRFSAVAYWFGRMLRDSLQVPVGLICNAVGGSPTESWIDRHSLETHFPKILENWLHNDLIQPWVRSRSQRNLGLENTPANEDFLHRHPFEPCYLFEAGIQPLERFPVQGVIWYQGESNAHNKDAHEHLFRLFVDSWRTYWQQPDLPFYFVQLSSLSRPSWPAFRDSQRQLAQHISNVHMAVSSDLGDSLDVHPRHKQAVGERLALQALVHEYGFSVTAGGPVFQQAARREEYVEVYFDQAEGLRTADNAPLRTFELATEPGLFFPAEATIEGSLVRLKIPAAVSRPRLVRYGWQPFTRANLVNNANLPASTFWAEVSEEE